METKDLARELDAIVDGIQGIKTEYEARLVRAQTLLKEFYAFAGQEHYYFDPQRLAAQSRDSDGRPQWMRDAREKAYDAIERWLVAHGLRPPVR